MSQNEWTTTELRAWQSWPTSHPCPAQVKYARYRDAVRGFLDDFDPQRVPVIAVVGAGRGPLVDASLAAADAAKRVVDVFAVEKNDHAVVTLRGLALNRDAWKGRVTVFHGDMRDAALRGAFLADCLVSELLGSFGDNELSPECLDGAVAHCLREGGVSIPCEYTSFAQPISAAKLWFDARRANTGAPAGPPAVGACVGAPPPDRGLETPFVVKLHNFAPLAPTLACFTFAHGAAATTQAATPGRNDRDAFLRFDLAVDCTIHGLAGYFDARLYGDVHISIHPPTFSEGMFSWFPLFIPFKAPIHVKAGDELAVALWRRSDKARVWYEWAVLAPDVSPVHNPNGRSYAMLL